MNNKMADLLVAAQTFLFVPGDRPDRFDKAASAGADVVILDLEDAVAPTDKDRARDNVREWLRRGHVAMVRVNAAGTSWHHPDVSAVADCASALMIPKAEDAQKLRCIAVSAPRLPIIPLVETAKGIHALAEICAAPQVIRLAFGSIDLAVQLGVDPFAREALQYSRSAIVAASAAAGLAGPIDGVTTTIWDEHRITEDTVHARRLGLLAKLCIHPAQLAAVRCAYAPSAEDIDWAQRVIAATSDGHSAVAVDGAMVDTPVILRARSILHAGRSQVR
jgi:citrate lyase subunit beta/citryl-CoA lyase